MKHKILLSKTILKTAMVHICPFWATQHPPPALQAPLPH